MKMLMITVKNIPQKNSHFDFPFGIIELVPVKLVFMLFSAPMLFIISFLLTCAFSFSMKSAFFLNLLKIHCSISLSISGEFCGLYLNHERTSTSHLLFISDLQRS